MMHLPDIFCSIIFKLPFLERYKTLKTQSISIFSATFLLQHTLYTIHKGGIKHSYMLKVICIFVVYMFFTA